MLHKFCAVVAGQRVDFNFQRLEQTNQGFAECGGLFVFEFFHPKHACGAVIDGENNP